MKTKPGNNTIVSIGICSALAASLCCITPVLAFIAGASGLVATFAWIEPARPLLIGVTLLILGFAWYQKLKPGVSCACVDGKTTFFQSYIFLGLVTLFIGATLTFPYYASVFYPETKLPNVIVVDTKNVQNIEFKIEGMTCEGCAIHISHAVRKIEGVINASVFYEKGVAEIQFDASMTSAKVITEAINTTGYKVTSWNMK